MWFLIFLRIEEMLAVVIVLNSVKICIVSNTQTLHVATCANV